MSGVEPRWRLRHGWPAKLVRRIVPAKWRPIGYLEGKTYADVGGRVYGGPFKGTKYLRRAFGSAYIPKLLGIYESELHDVIDRICELKSRVIVDIGAAEGYYAVGLALRNPQAKVYAFEAVEEARCLLMELRAINGVDAHVEILGRCERPDLQEILEQHESSVIICDCEGCEVMLLDPLRAPALRRAHVLVEVHDYILAGISEELSGRFGDTHNIREIWQVERRIEDYPFRSAYLALLPRGYLRWAVNEWRPYQMSWLWMEPKVAGAWGSS